MRPTGVGCRRCASAGLIDFLEATVRSGARRQSILRAVNAKIALRRRIVIGIDDRNRLSRTGSARRQIIRRLQIGWTEARRVARRRRWSRRRNGCRCLDRGGRRDRRRRWPLSWRGRGFGSRRRTIAAAPGVRRTARTRVQTVITVRVSTPDIGANEREATRKSFRYRTTA